MSSSARRPSSSPIPVTMNLGCRRREARNLERKPKWRRIVGMEWSCTDYTCIVPGLWPKLNRLNQTGYGSAAKARCSPAGRSRASCRSAGDMPSSCSELSAGRPSGFPGAGMPPSFSLCRSCPRVGPRGNDMIMFLFLMFYNCACNGLCLLNTLPESWQTLHSRGAAPSQSSSSSR